MSSSSRAVLLETKIKARAIDTQRHLRALEDATTSFGDDLDLEEFEASVSIEALRLLQENGVITARARQALKDAHEQRSDVQHDYVGVAARAVHALVEALLEHAPDLLQGVADQLRQR